MKQFKIGKFDCYDARRDVCVLGSGAAGMNAARILCAQKEAPYQSVCLFTTKRFQGTSYNTGSDKQTYYKLSLSGAPDSVMSMAEDLFKGEGVQGDTAYIEACESVYSFMNLASLGVPFPTNEYGEYVGYKTDHDPRARATSAGPLTSHWMVEKLNDSLKEAEEKGFCHVIENKLAVKLLVNAQNELWGFVMWDETKACDPETNGFELVLCNELIMATGGPAGCYLNSVYPVSQWGASSLALKAGAAGTNLSEWQYGLASVDFRWNVSGSYQQVLPRYISIDDEGREYEFLPEYFEKPEEAISAEFRKGYEWPFDASRVNASSKVDIAVYSESVLKGRKVYMDFTRNPSAYDERTLCEEAHTYLKNSGCFAPTPFERLQKMNPAAIELYRSHNIDLEKDPLRIALCAQHHNGGISVDKNWESTVRNLFVAGEAAGTFGVHRPGGSALNSTQVGSKRAAEEIIRRRKHLPKPDEALDEACSLRELEAYYNLTKVMQKQDANVAAVSSKVRAEMSRVGAQFRNTEDLKALKNNDQALLAKIREKVSYQKPQEILAVLKLMDILETQSAVADAMILAAEHFGSRGGTLVLEKGARLDETDKYIYKTNCPNEVIVTQKSSDGYHSHLEKVRPLPEADTWFESAWRAYRERNN